MKGAQDDMIGEPTDQQPTRPVVGAPHKHGADNRQQAHKTDPGQVVVKRMVEPKLAGVVGESDQPCPGEYTADDRDRTGTFVHWTPVTGGAGAHRPGGA